MNSAVPKRVDVGARVAVAPVRVRVVVEQQGDGWFVARVEGQPELFLLGRDRAEVRRLAQELLRAPQTDDV